MSKKIIFQKCNFNNLYFLFYIIIDFLHLFIGYNLYPKDPNSPDDKDKTIPKYILPTLIIFHLYTYNISDFLAIIPYFIRKRLLKRKERIFLINKSKIIIIMIIHNLFIIITNYQ